MAGSADGITWKKRGGSMTLIVVLRQRYISAGLRLTGGRLGEHEEQRLGLKNERG